MENTSQTPPPVGTQEEQAGGGNFERLREYLAAANKYAVGSQFYEQATRVDRNADDYEPDILHNPCHMALADARQYLGRLADFLEGFAAWRKMKGKGGAA